MLTGDKKNVGENVAKKLNIDEVYTELLPDGKVEKVETRFDVLEEKADKLDTKSDRIDAKTDRIEKHIVDEMNDTSQMVNILFGQTGKITNYLGLTWDIKHIN